MTLSALGLVVVALVSGAPPAHAVEFWRSVVRNTYTPPAGSDVAALSAELSELLGSPDPELRDEIAYSTLASWIYQKRILEPDALRRLMAQWEANLEKGLGTAGSDDVFKRSFSALALSVLVARDNAAPFLEPAEFHQLRDAALRYLADEKDLRGFDEKKGWIHSAAHTADLLKVLGRSRNIDAAGQQLILQGITRKLQAASVVFTHGEDERLARAVLSIVNRKDFEQEGFRAWLTGSRPTPAAGPLPTAAHLRASQNVKNFLAKLQVVLSGDLQPSESVQAARDSVRAVLKDLF